MYCIFIIRTIIQKFIFCKKNQSNNFYLLYFAFSFNKFLQKYVNYYKKQNYEGTFIRNKFFIVLKKEMKKSADEGTRTPTVQDH